MEGFSRASNKLHTYDDDLIPRSVNPGAILQIYDHKMKKMSTIDISNIGNILYNIEDRTIAINIVLPGDSEILFKAKSHQLLVSWIATLRVAMSKGTYIKFHVYNL